MKRSRRIAHHGARAVLGAVALSAAAVMVASARSLTFWAWYWLFLFFGLFLVPEVYWVLVDPANTVSDNTWRFESIDIGHPFDFSRWTAVHWAFAAIYVPFAILLGLHLIFGFFHGHRGMP